jgi:hypothetical protein
MLTHTWSIHLTAFTIIHIFTYRVFLVWWFEHRSFTAQKCTIQTSNYNSRTQRHDQRNTEFKLSVSSSDKEQCLPRHTWTQFRYCTRIPSHGVTDNTRISHAKQQCINNLTLNRAVAIFFSTSLTKADTKRYTLQD